MLLPSSPDRQVGGVDVAVGARSAAHRRLRQRARLALHQLPRALADFLEWRLQPAAQTLFAAKIRRVCTRWLWRRVGWRVAGPSRKTDGGRSVYSELCMDHHNFIIIIGLLS